MPLEEIIEDQLVEVDSNWSSLSSLSSHVNQGFLDTHDSVSMDLWDSDMLMKIEEGSCSKQVVSEVSLTDHEKLIASIDWLKDHVPVCVLNQLGQENKKLGLSSNELPHKSNHESALLFVDVAGFTQLSLIVDPEQLSKVSLTLHYAHPTLLGRLGQPDKTGHQNWYLRSPPSTGMTAPVMERAAGEAGDNAHDQRCGDEDHRSAREGGDRERDHRDAAAAHRLGDSLFVKRRLGHHGCVEVGDRDADPHRPVAGLAGDQHQPVRPAQSGRGERDCAHHKARSHHRRGRRQ